jgi:hypothetical protein
LGVVWAGTRTDPTKAPIAGDSSLRGLLLNQNALSALPIDVHSRDALRSTAAFASMTCLPRSLTVLLNDQLSAYLALTTLLVITPGSSIAVVVDGVLEGGMRRGIATAVGVAAALPAKIAPSYSVRFRMS